MTPELKEVTARTGKNIINAIFAIDCTADELEENGATKEDVATLREAVKLLRSWEDSARKAVRKGR